MRDLITEVETASDQAGNETPPAVRQSRARMYLAASAMLAKLGEFDAAWVAIDRATASAHTLKNAHLLAECAFRLAIVFQASRRFDMARRVAGDAANALSQTYPQGDSDPATYALLGALHLQLATASARSGDGDAAYRYLNDAREAAEHVHDGRNDYNTEFGPTNVSLHEVAVAVELGDAGRALRVAEQIDDGRLSAERQGRFLIDVASASAQLRRTDAVINALRRSFTVSPQQARSHSRARTLIADLLRSHGDDPRVKELAGQVTSN